jgi:hypothetical protein
MAGSSPAKGIFGCSWIVGDNDSPQPDSRGGRPGMTGEIALDELT